MAIQLNYSDSALNRPRNFQRSDFFSQYECCTEHLLIRLTREHPHYLDVLTYQQQLVENLHMTRQHGDTSERRARRSEILMYLNEITLRLLSMKFEELCGAPPKGDTLAHPIYEAGLALVSLFHQSQEVHDKVILYLYDFQVVCEQNIILSSYKQLHDLFQELENDLEQVFQAFKRLPGDQSAWDDLDCYEPKIQHVIDELLSATEQIPRSPRGGVWMSWLSHAREDMRGAAEYHDDRLLQHALKDLNRVLTHQPPYINDRLVTIAGSLRLANLIEDLRVIHAGLIQPGQDQTATYYAEELKKGIDALQKLNDRLAILVATHNDLQSIHNELRRIETFLHQGREELLEELETSWPDLDFLLQKTCTRHEFEWVLKLKPTYGDLKQHFVARDLDNVKRSFRRCRSLITSVFTRVDRALVNLCAASITAGEPLEFLLRIIHDE